MISHISADIFNFDAGNIIEKWAKIRISNNNDQMDLEKQGFGVKEPFIHTAFDGSCPKKKH